MSRIRSDCDKVDIRFCILEISGNIQASRLEYITNLPVKIMS
jgi:hypothetical protein